MSYCHQPYWIMGSLLYQYNDVTHLLITSKLGWFANISEQLSKSPAINEKQNASFAKLSAISIAFASRANNAAVFNDFRSLERARVWLAVRGSSRER